ncbi:hypothetical protein PCIT_a1841 [Pseudoalteromonas citrea]|uniref:Uncharacterized protein n=2 Tax=Pseudoalteromonas citrea TaxID=43655 RepID=A0AAD4AIV0_9GAMM|nr:hypothetical protein PCIT_a1841 [Pseudoalteromonas citrea]
MFSSSKDNKVAPVNAHLDVDVQVLVNKVVLSSKSPPFSLIHSLLENIKKVQETVSIKIHETMYPPNNVCKPLIKIKLKCHRINKSKLSFT